MLLLPLGLIIFPSIQLNCFRMKYRHCIGIISALPIPIRVSLIITIRHTLLTFRHFFFFFCHPNSEIEFKSRSENQTICVLHKDEYISHSHTLCRHLFHLWMKSSWLLTACQVLLDRQNYSMQWWQTETRLPLIEWTFSSDDMSGFRAN